MKEPIEIPDTVDAPYYSGFEDEEMLEQGIKWMDEIKKSPVYGSRFVKLWGDNLDQKSIFLPRLDKK
jgi:hypothetical protein